MNRSICFTILIILFNYTVCYSAGQDKVTLNQFVSDEDSKQIKSQLDEKSKKIYEQEKGKRPIAEIVDDILITSMAKVWFTAVEDYMRKGETDAAIEELMIIMEALKNHQLEKKYSHYGQYLSVGYTLEAMIENEKKKPDYLKSFDSVKRAIKEYPDTKFFETWFQGGYALYKTKRFKESVTFLTTALEANQDKDDRQRALNMRARAAAMSYDNDLMTKVAYPDSKALITEDKNTDSQIYFIAGSTAYRVVLLSSDKDTKLVAANDCIDYLSRFAMSDDSRKDPNLESKITQCRVSKDEAQ